LKKVMLLAAMLAMVLAAAVPALAQSVTQVGSDNEACVQTAVQTEVGKVQISQYGDNVNIQAISQQCNVTVEQVSSVVASVSSASASASPAAAQYQYKAPAAAQYQYSSPSASASASAAAELPETGGSSLIALGAGVLLVAGGLVARRIVR
jgi:LPXTG-motif cell wall-anchored protein